LPHAGRWWQGHKEDLGFAVMCYFMAAALPNLKCPADGDLTQPTFSLFSVFFTKVK